MIRRQISNNSKKKALSRLTATHIAVVAFIGLLFLGTWRFDTEFSIYHLIIWFCFAFFRTIFWFPEVLTIDWVLPTYICGGARIDGVEKKKKDKTNCIS